MKRFTSLLNRSKSHDSSNNAGSNNYDLENAPTDSPEANAGRAIRLFCESGSNSNGGEEVLHLPVIVDVAESSPVAAGGAAQQIRKFLTKEWSQKPHVQYNAIMLIRILCDNPGATFTRNFDRLFVSTVKECLRNCKDQSTQQILRETLDNLEVQKAHDEGVQLLLQMWRKEKGQQASLSHSGSRRAAPYPSHAQQGPYMTSPPNQEYEQVYTSSNGNRQSRQPRSRSTLPSPSELASRIEEAKNTAKILMQLLQSTAAEEVLANELIKEFSERCQSAQKSMQNYINCDNPAPDDDTLQTLIETNEQLSLAGSRYQRAILAGRRAMGVNPSPTPPVDAPGAGGVFALAPVLGQNQVYGQEPQQQAYGNGYFQQPVHPPQPAPPMKGQNGYNAPPGPPQSMMSSFQRRDAQQEQACQPSPASQYSQPANRTSAYQPTPPQQYNQPIDHRTSAYQPTPPQQYTLPEIHRSDPFADPVEHEENPAPLAVVPNHGYGDQMPVHQQRPSQSFNIDAEPLYASSPTHERQKTADLENAYSSGHPPLSPEHSPDLSREHNDSPQRPALGPYHTSGVTPSYVGRQASAANGLTMHGAEPNEMVTEIDSHSDVGRNDPHSATTSSSGGYGVSPVEVRTAQHGRRFRSSLVGHSEH